MGSGSRTLAGTKASRWRWAASGLGVYALVAAAGMLFDSKVGKLALRERLIDTIRWQGHERVLDIGCGRGLLAVAAARRAASGAVIGVDMCHRSAYQ